MSVDFDAFQTLISELCPNDIIGGIDNEIPTDIETFNNDGIDFSNFMQDHHHQAAVDHIDGSITNNNKIHDNNLIYNPKIESPSNLQQTNLTGLQLPTVSARVCLTSTPIATPLPAVLSHNQTASHLPESPPDSGSEPPYSPLQDVHGLTLTSREVYTGFTGLQPPQLLQLQHQHQQQHQQQHHQQQLPQYSSPPPPIAQQQQQQQQQQQRNQNHYLHHIENNGTFTTHGMAGMSNNGANIRVKNESNLIMNPTNLMQDLTNQNLLSSYQTSLESHMDLNASQFLYPASTNANTNANLNNILHYENSNTGLYPIVSTLKAEHVSPHCMLPTINDGPRVQLIGTSHANSIPGSRTSAPSTPVHSSTRKRKMSTQIECTDFNNIKMDPSNTPHHTSNAEAQKLSPISPVNINLPLHSSVETGSNSNHSSALLSPALSTINSNTDGGIDTNGNNTTGSTSGENSDPNALTPSITFSPFQQQNWHQLCDQKLKELSDIYYSVDADKGFNFSVSDNAFVCQKKNHFQITCHTRLQGDAEFVKTKNGIEKIKSFCLHFYGVKFETPNHKIKVEQSQPDRSKKPFYPVQIDLQSHTVSKITVGRLHFSETTNNNMRKKGRPNPEQRYFQLVVGLHAETISGNYPIVSQGSERIIVRASNPGQFESDVDLLWQRSPTDDSIYHIGRVGINTDRPDESLVVHGNLKVSGHILQQSDRRAKQEIHELDTSVQLRNLQKIRIVRYRYDPEFAVHIGLKRTSEIVDTGVIAQEVQEVIPDAVQEAGSIKLSNGNVIKNFLVVNKDRILMENIGAVKELCKVTERMNDRLENLERRNHRLQYETKKDNYELCSNRSLLITIFFLVFVMAACLAAVSTLYFVEHNSPERHLKPNMFRFNGSHVLTTHFENFTDPTTPRHLSRNYVKQYPEFPSDENDDPINVIQKPMASQQQIFPKENYKTTTTGPHPLSNKSSKHKSKSEQNRSGHITAPKVITSPTDNKDVIKINNSTEKIADQFLLPQDYENNSIDTDAAQHAAKKPAPPKKAASTRTLTASINDATADQGQETFIRLVDDTAATVDSLNVIKYKTVPTPTAATLAAVISNEATPDGTQTNLSFVSNKIQGVVEHAINNSDDLQYLSSNNESTDNSFNDQYNAGDLNNEATLARRAVIGATLDLLIQKKVLVETFGLPPQCTQNNMREDISNCQSVCFEDSNQLPSPLTQSDSIQSTESKSKNIENSRQNYESERDILTVEDVDVEEESEEGNANLPKHTNGKTSYATQSVSKQSDSEPIDASETSEQSNADDLLPVDSKIIADKNLKLSIEVNRAPDADCLRILNFIIAEGLNKSFGIENYCPNNGKSLNISYIIPLSKFFKESSIELHFGSSNALLWSFCNQNELLKRNDQDFNRSNAHHQQQQQQLCNNKIQQRQNTSVLILNIPSRGSFSKDLTLRASIDLEKQNICQEPAHEAYTLFQYNIRILRDCD